LRYYCIGIINQSYPAIGVPISSTYRTSYTYYWTIGPGLKDSILGCNNGNNATDFRSRVPRSCQLVLTLIIQAEGAHALNAQEVEAGNELA